MWRTLAQPKEDRKQKTDYRILICSIYVWTRSGEPELYKTKDFLHITTSITLATPYAFLHRHNFLELKQFSGTRQAGSRVNTKHALKLRLVPHENTSSESRSGIGFAPKLVHSIGSKTILQLDHARIKSSSNISRVPRPVCSCFIVNQIETSASVYLPFHPTLSKFLVLPYVHVRGTMKGFFFFQCPPIKRLFRSKYNAKISI